MVKPQRFVRIKAVLTEHTAERCRRDHDRIMEPDDAEYMLPHSTREDEADCRCTTEEVT